MHNEQYTQLKLSRTATLTKSTNSSAAFGKNR